MVRTRIALSVAIFLFGAVVCYAQKSDRKELSSGVILENFDKAITVSDDFYRHVNNTWLEKTQIPADKSRYGAFTILDENVKSQVKAIIEEVASSSTEKSGPSQQVGDLYRASTDTERRNELGWQPIAELLEKVTGLSSKEEWSRLQSQLDRLGVPGAINVYVDQDARRSDQYAIHLTQAGITLPDRDYYLGDEQRYEDARKALSEYVAKSLDKAAFKNSSEQAAAVVDFEKKIAAVQWTQVEQRDPIKSYNKVDIATFTDNHPALNWRLHATEAGLPMNGQLIVGQPSFFAGLDKLLAEAELTTLQAYTAFHIVDAFAPFLDETTERQHFAFHETALSGVTEQQPLWKRGVDTCSGLLGMPVGQLYVAKHFSSEAKERMQRMVETLRKAFEVRIKKLEWMGEGTKKQALAKLDLFTHKIGYPDRWKDYSSVAIKPDSIVANVMRINEFEHSYSVNKLGKPIDRTEWFMPPQMVNAYYNPQMNEIVFPAAILQPPFFNLAADDAVNYGGIGAVIGHEFSHGFDDQGSKYDGRGNLRDWWTPDDRAEFERRAKKLVDQYSRYKPFDDMNVNGELTLGENIGDLGGMNAAYTAYQIALDGKSAPVIDGFTGDQRFLIGWAQVWLFKYRDTELRKRLLTDPHSPAQYRTNGIVSNLDIFYNAFSIKPDSPMWIAPNDRVRIW